MQLKLVETLNVIILKLAEYFDKEVLVEANYTIKGQYSIILVQVVTSNIDKCSNLAYFCHVCSNGMRLELKNFLHRNEI